MVDVSMKVYRTYFIISFFQEVHFPENNVNIR